MLRSLLSGWVILGAFVLAALLLGFVVILVLINRPAPGPPAPATAVVNVIPASTATLIPTETPTPGPPTPTQADAPPPPPPGEIYMDAYVQISGTEGDGLRLRVDPSLEADVRLLAAEAEVFHVEEGPAEADGYTWWYLVGPYDTTRRGWGVSNYLTVIQWPE